MHFGEWLDAELGFTTPLAQLEAVRTTNPINLGWDKVCETDRTVLCRSSDDCPGGIQACISVSPTLTWKHQVSMLDHRLINSKPFRAADRGVVSAQLADDAGNPVGDWIRLEPYENAYDTQVNSNFFYCNFDPIDDGNNEESFFDPLDPLRELGPSSTCDPLFAFADQGETGHPFDIDNIGDAPDGPGLRGASGTGTWVQPKVDLNQFRGRRLRLRFLASTMKASSFVIWEQVFVSNPDPREDGWFIDDVTVTDTLWTPATVRPDLKDNGTLSGCGATCGTVSAAADLSPAITSAPGQVVLIQAAQSSVDFCLSGVLEFQYWIDVDRSGTSNPEADVLLRDWTQNDEFLDTPQGSVDYVVAVRCSSDPTCFDDVSVSVQVACPTGPAGLGLGGSESNPFLNRSATGQRDVVFADRTELRWPTAATADVVQGDLNALRGSGSFVGSAPTCLVDNASTARASVLDMPAAYRRASVLGSTPSAWRNRPASM